MHLALPNTQRGTGSVPAIAKEIKISPRLDLNLPPVQNHSNNYSPLRFLPYCPGCDSTALLPSIPVQQELKANA